MRRQRKKLLSLCTDCVQLPGLSPLQHKGRVLISFQDACFLHACAVSKVFSGGSVVKNPPASARAIGLVPGLGGFPGGRNGNPRQYSCLENPMDRGAWWATVHGVAKSQTWLSEHACTLCPNPLHDATAQCPFETWKPMSCVGIPRRSQWPNFPLCTSLIS